MKLEEKLTQGDRIKKLSDKQIEAKKKKRADKLREKLGLPDTLSDEKILSAESKIADALTDHVEEVEGDMVQVEGNVAENLIQAAESHDGDAKSSGSTKSSKQIKAALDLADRYHKRSSHRAHTQLKKKNEDFGKALHEEFKKAA